MGEKIFKILQLFKLGIFLKGNTATVQPTSPHSSAIKCTNKFKENHLGHLSTNLEEAKETSAFHNKKNLKISCKSGRKMVILRTLCAFGLSFQNADLEIFRGL